MIRDFFKEYKYNGRPALVLGKGPSYRNPSQEELSNHLVVSLNHTVRETPVDIAHIIDLDVIEKCGDLIYKNAKILLVPYYPHMGWRPNPHITLEELSQKQSTLKKMREEGRLYGYNLSTASQMFNKVWNDSPIVWADYFSAEAVTCLLGKLGVKQIRTLGVDGGKGQADSFKDLQNINTNGYDAEWKGIRKSIRKYNLDYAPLGVESPIRIFVGAGDQQIIPALVLKHSIEKNVTMNVDVTIMNEWTHPMPKDPRNRPRTPFSFQRFMIPEKCDYKGHAIYMDSDMLVFGDVKEIWKPEEMYFISEEDKIFGVDVMAMRNDDIDRHKAKFSVVLIDCGDSEWNIKDIISELDNGNLNYEQLVFDFKVAREIRDGFNPDWNSLEEYTEGKTKLLHYTEMYNQPWLVNPNHPLGHLWFSELKEAVNDNSISKDLVDDHIKRGWILPKCLEVLD